MLDDRSEFLIKSIWRSPANQEFKKIEERKFMLTASRFFRDADEMNEALKGVKDKTLRIHVSLENKFRWFFTTIRYQETYKKFDPFNFVPITDYLSKTELDLFLQYVLHKQTSLSKGDSLSVKDAGDRFDEWQARNMFESYFNTFTQGVRNLNDQSLTVEAVTTKKEELFKKCLNRFNSDNFDTVRIIFSNVLKTPLVNKVADANKTGFADFFNKKEFVDRILHTPYKTNIIMPGLITKTNAPTLEGNKASWNEFISYCYFNDFDLWVESEVTNWWVIILTGVIVIIAVLVLVISIFKRRAVTNTV